MGAMIKTAARSKRNATRQANFLLPADLLADLKSHVAAREQSKFVSEAVRKELKRLKFARALETSFGAWKDEDHEELREGTAAYVKRLRRSSRNERVT